MKIGYITPYFYPYVGGVQKCVLRLAQNLNRKGNSITVVSSDFVPSWANPGELTEVFPVRRLKCIGRIAEVPLVPTLSKGIRDLDVDVLHVNGMYPLFSDIALFSSKINGLPVLLNYHFDPIPGRRLLAPLSKTYLAIAPTFVKKADAIVATGTSYVQASPILSHMSIDIDTIPNGVEEKFFKRMNSNDLDLIRQKFKIARDEKVILFVGQLKRFKGINVLMRAFKILSRTGISCRLLIVGAGPELEALRILAKDLKLSERVVFAGYVSEKELPLFYQLSDIYVLPSISRIENFGITLLEAMASQKPVIASNLPGPNEVVENGVNGFLFSPGDFQYLASLLMKLLIDDELASLMAAEGRKKAGFYSWDKISALFLRKYEDIAR